MDLISSNNFYDIKLQCTKEIFLLRILHADNTTSWTLDISAYGELWKEQFDTIDKAEQYLIARWNVSRQWLDELVKTAKTITVATPPNSQVRQGKRG